MGEVIQSPTFIAGVFTVIGMLLTGVGFLIKWVLTERKARKEREEQDKREAKQKETETERLIKENQEKVIRYLDGINSTLRQLNSNQDLLKQACFLSLESVDLQLRELHEKGILNGESKIQRKKIAEFYKKCANDVIFTKLDIKSDYLDPKSDSKSKKIS